MMVQCPKCSFTQPKDRYCANCGVDMEAFTPKAKPLSARISSSAGFYIFLLGIVVLATVYFFFNQRRGEELRESLSAQAPIAPNPNSGTPSVISSQGITVSAPGANEKRNNNSGSSPDYDTSAMSGSAAQAHPAAGATGSLGTAGSVATASPPGEPSSVSANQEFQRMVKVTFAEAPVNLFPSGSGTLTHDQTETILEGRGTRWAVLGEHQFSELKVEKTNVETQELTDPRVENGSKAFGVSIKLTPKSLTSTDSKVEVEIVATWPEKTATAGAFTTHSNSTPLFTTNLPQGQMFYLGNLLPHRALAQDDREWASIVVQHSLLKVLTSANFYATPPKTDFVVILEALDIR